MCSIMEDLLATDSLSGRPTNFGVAFKRAVQFLQSRQIAHVFLGTLALNTCMRPRFTNQIQIVCEHDEMEPLAEEIDRIAAQSAFGGSFRLSKVESAATAYALASRSPKTLFGAPADFPSALALCWTFLESNDLAAQADAGSLLAAGVVSDDELQSLLQRHAYDAALRHLNDLRREIHEGRYSGTYNDSVRARLLRR